MREITIAEFLQGYEDKLIEDVVYIPPKVYGRSVKGMALDPEGYEVVWATIP